MSKKFPSAFLFAVLLMLSLPLLAGQPNGPRNRETKEPRFTDGQNSGSPIVRIVRAIKKGIRALDDGLTVPTPKP